MPSASTVAMDSSLLFQVTALSVASSGNTVVLMVCVLPTVRTPSLESSVMDSIALPTVTLVSALAFSGTTSISLSTPASSAVAVVSATMVVVMVHSPTPTAVTLPDSSTVATDSSLLK